MKLYNHSAYENLSLLKYIFMFIEFFYKAGGLNPLNLINMSSIGNSFWFTFYIAAVYTALITLIIYIYSRTVFSTSIIRNIYNILKAIFIVYIAYLLFSMPAMLWAFNNTIQYPQTAAYVLIVIYIIFFIIFSAAVISRNEKNNQYKLEINEDHDDIINKKYIICFIQTYKSEIKIIHENRVTLLPEINDVPIPFNKDNLYDKSREAPTLLHLRSETGDYYDAVYFSTDCNFRLGDEIKILEISEVNEKDEDLDADFIIEYFDLD